MKSKWNGKRMLMIREFNFKCEWNASDVDKLTVIWVILIGIKLHHTNYFMLCTHTHKSLIHTEFTQFWMFVVSNESLVISYVCWSCDNRSFCHNRMFFFAAIGRLSQMCVRHFFFFEICEGEKKFVVAKKCHWMVEIETNALVEPGHVVICLVQVLLSNSILFNVFFHLKTTNPGFFSKFVVVFCFGSL